MSRWSETLKISKSQLMTYLQCPRKYRYHYVEGRDWEFVPATLAFGSAIHKAAARFYVHFQRFQRITPLEDVLLEFQDAWSKATTEQPIRFSGELNEEELTGRGIELLKLFHAEIQPREIYGVELPFLVDFGRPRHG